MLAGCNRCGACCYVNGYRCVNLFAADDGRTTCAVYQQRQPGMKIILTKPDGQWIEGVCVHGLPIEERILTQMMGEGLCSLEVTDG